MAKTAEIILGKLVEAMQNKADLDLDNLDEEGKAKFKQILSQLTFNFSNDTVDKGYENYFYVRLGEALIQGGYHTGNVLTFPISYVRRPLCYGIIYGSLTLNGQVTHTMLNSNATKTTMHVYAEIANGPTAQASYFWIAIGREADAQ